MNFRRFSMTDPNIHLVGGNPQQLLSNVSIPPGLAGHSHQYLPHIPNINNMPHPPSMVQNNIPPALPPRLDLNQVLAQPVVQNQALGGVGVGMGSYGGMGMGSYGGMGMGSYGGMGTGSYGMGGYGGYGGYGMGGMGGMYGGYNRIGVGGGYGDADSRFIQIAEESSRPAFDSIQSCVHAVGSVAMMLESTFFAITSSFRAILGVAENASRLKSLFAQVWSTFAVIRTLNWIIRKLMVIIGIRTENEFKAWAEAVASTQQTGPVLGPKSSGWPVVMFFGVLAAAPYVVLKMLSRLNKSMQEKLNDPSTWQEPIRAYAKFNFTGTSPQELSVQEKQHFYVAPSHLQPQLWNSGWLMASLDGKTAGLVPTNYIRLINPNYVHDNKQQDRRNSAAGYSASANNATAYSAAVNNAAAYSAAANNATAYSAAANNATAYSAAANNATAYSAAANNAAVYSAAANNAAATNAAATNAAATNSADNNAAANNASNVRQG